jgi:hypothetical protein
MSAMGSSLESCLPPLDVSSVAGQITAILAQRHDEALLRGDDASAERYDAGLDTIYFASLLLMVVDGTGELRRRDQVLSVLDAVEDVLAELRDWVEGTTL